MYYIRVHPGDVPNLYGPGGILHLGPHKGLQIGMFEKQYYYIEYAKEAARLSENEKNTNNIGTAIKIRRTPWGE